MYTAPTNAVSTYRDSHLPLQEVTRHIERAPLAGDVRPTAAARSGCPVQSESIERTHDTPASSMGGYGRAKRLVLVSCLVGMGLLASACGGSHVLYSAHSFRDCVARNHLRATLSRGPRSSQVVLVTTPAFAEWLYFFESGHAARNEESRLRVSPIARDRVLFRLLRGRRANALIFAPQRKSWRSTIDPCLRH